MGSLVLSESLFELFVGALLTVARADGAVRNDEMDMLLKIATELRPSHSLDAESLLATDVSPNDLATAVRSLNAGAFRSVAVSAPDVIGRAFMDAAMRIARVDGELDDHELSVLRRFSGALGVKLL